MADADRQKKGSFFGGAAVLAMGIAIVKIIGALYKIPIVNILGEEAYAHFTNAYYIYTVLLTVSTAGLPVALSKLVSEASTLGRYNQVHKTFRVALLAFLTMGVVSFLAMFFGGGWLAEGLFNDILAAESIKALAPAVICVGCLSAFRGYAQGRANMSPTAISQIIEALCKLVIGLGLAIYLTNLGREGHIAAAGAITGVTVGTVLALLYMTINYLVSKRRETSVGRDVADGSLPILSKLLQIAIPITLSSSMVAIITVIDASLVQGQLKNALGMSLSARSALYGSYSGVMTLYNLPSAFMVALTASIIPAVSAAQARHDRRGAARVVGSSLRTTALLAFPAGIGLCVLAQPIVTMLFPKLDAELSGSLLAVLGIASIFVCIMMVTNSILQAHGFVNLPIVTMLIGGALKIVVNYNLVAIPSIHIHGAPIGTLICFGVTSALNLLIIKRVVPACPSYFSVFTKPLLAALVMGAAAWGVHGLLLAPLGNRLATLLAIVIACAVYLVLVLALRAITREDLSLMPKGDKLARLLHMD